MFKRASKVCRSLLGAHAAALSTSRAGLVQCKEPRQRGRQTLPLHPWPSCFTSASSFENEDGHMKVKRKPRNRGGTGELMLTGPRLCTEFMVRVLFRPHGHLEKEALLSHFVREERKAQLGEGTCPRLHNCCVEKPAFDAESENRFQPSNHSFCLPLTRHGTAETAFVSGHNFFGLSHPHDFMNPFHSYKEAEEQGLY